VIFCLVLAQGLVANQQDFVIGTPKVFAKQMNHLGIIPHILIDDDVSGESQSFHLHYLSFFVSVL
jgi:hypothetical protein